jgi:REP element-mobilizing transposase RayT
MQFEIDNIYHIYNQGNNKQLIFHSAENYLYFLKLYRKFVLPHADLLAYCLMPNHFHFLVNTNLQSIKIRKVGSLNLSELSNGIRMLLSSYSLAINKQEKSTGSQFRQNTQAKLLNIEEVNYPFTCFQYIHQNPLKAGLVERMEDWEYSSFKDYLKITTTTADGTLAATQFCSVDQFIEGYNVADLNWGTANAKSVTLSFYVKSSLTGNATNL